MRLNDRLKEQYRTFRNLRQMSRYRATTLQRVFEKLDQAYDAMPPQAQQRMDNIAYEIGWLRDDLNYRNWGH